MASRFQFGNDISGDAILGVVGKTGKMRAVVDTYEAVLFVRYCAKSSTYLTLFSAQQGCEVASVIMHMLQVRKVKHRKMPQLPKDHRAGQ